MIHHDQKHSGMLLIVASILLGSAAQLVIKIGMNLLPAHINFFINFPWDTFIWVLLGLTGYALSMLLWMMAISKYELSFAYPMLSLSYVLVYAGAVLLPQLNESVSPGKTLGILLIVAGVVMVTRSK